MVKRARMLYGDGKLRNTSFLQTQTILQALEFTLGKGGFKNAAHKKAATALVMKMTGGDSVSGRHQQLRAVLERGATLKEMIKVTNSSRRTIFRYLNHFEEAGLSIELLDGKYKVG